MALTAESVTAVVPTVGRSPLVGDCLAALRQEGGARLRIVLVEQGGAPGPVEPSLAVERLRAPELLGFARAANLGIAAARTPWIALVNDDAVPRAPWLEPLVEALERDARAAAAQGVNLERRALSIGPAGQRIDGCGLEWNDRWQAVQLLHHRPVSEAPTTDREVFGVSATAAVYRRSALEAAAGAGGAAFDARLGAYYEDVDLACRLRAKGFRAWLVAAAACEHLGSASLRAGDRLALVYRNRYLVLARLLGRSFWPRLPLLVARDAATLVAAAAGGDRALAGAIARGLISAPRRLAGFASFERPLLDPIVTSSPAIDSRP
ncbi:MAG TPA: glycosyltransferase [Thermoanaerobaculia bacterium]|nr:glycosyltransferase [Thermoanaerobaculia bacterium]